MSTRLPMRIRKTGTPSRPWEVRCPDCRDERVHLHPAVGAVVVNSRGMGNRLWVLALLAVQEHRKACPARR